VKNVKRKTVLISTVALMTVLVASSMIAATQAWWWRPLTPNEEYIRYDLYSVPAEGEVIYIDDSGAPELIIVESTDTIIEGNLTIGGQVYTYPEDFDYEGITYGEINALTGEGESRIEKTFIFNLPANPTLKCWAVMHFTGFTALDEGEPAEISTEGEFQLTGTKQFATVEGFGIIQNLHHFGFIKGWPLP
jgi:hypothetical protein